MKHFATLLLCCVFLCSCGAVSEPKNNYINPPEVLTEEELDNSMKIESYYGVEFPFEKYKELVEIYANYTLDDSILLQLTSNEELEKFNEAFIRVGVKLPEHDFSQNFICVTIHSPLSSIEIERIDGQNAYFNKLFVSYYTSDNEQIASSISQDMLFVYLTECIYLKNVNGNNLNSVWLVD